MAGDRTSLINAGRLAQRGEPFVLITVIKAEGSTPRNPGARLIWRPDGSIEGTVGGGQFEHLLLDAAGDYFNTRSAGIEEFTLGRDADQCCGGRVTVFLEYVGPRQRVVIFGAGHVAKALAVTLEGAPFGLVVVDDRREWNTEENFPGATRLFEWGAGVAAALDQPEATMACVMTCSHETDLELVKQLLSTDRLGYLGLIGSRSKRANFFTRLAGSGVPDERIKAIDCPIGLGDMGKEPMSIAVSIAGRLLLKARELSDL